MSRHRQYIELAAQRQSPVERMKSYHHTCPHCCGNGWNWEAVGYYDRRQVTCPRCQGEGTLTAHITIEWKQNERKK